MDKAETQTYELYSSNQDLRNSIKEQIAEELVEQGIESNIYFHGDPIPANDVNDYKTEVVSTVEVVASGWAGNQPADGVIFNSDLGGTIYYTPYNGASVTVSVSFGDPHGVSNISFNLGQVISGVSAYGVHVPGYLKHKLWVDNTYTVTKYIVYKYVWIDDFSGYQWVEFSSGVNKTLSTISFTPIVM